MYERDVYFDPSRVRFRKPVQTGGALAPTSWLVKATHPAAALAVPKLAI